MRTRLTPADCARLDALVWREELAHQVVIYRALTPIQRNQWFRRALAAGATVAALERIANTAERVRRPVPLRLVA